MKKTQFKLVRLVVLFKFFVVTLLFSVLFLAGCRTRPNQDVTGQTFPPVQGENLKKEKVTLPDAFTGKHVVFLIGTKQNSQFDIDRWFLGFSDKGLTVPIYEIPTIEGMFPGMIAGKIDDGMRSGIPEHLWQNVVTLYGEDAKKVVKWTGNERPLNARVLLLDPEGKVLFFHDRGYSVPDLNRLCKHLPD